MVIKAQIPRFNIRYSTHSNKTHTWSLTLNTNNLYLTWYSMKLLGELTILLTEIGLSTEKITLHYLLSRWTFFLFISPFCSLHSIYMLVTVSFFSVGNPVKKTQTNGMKTSICSQTFWSTMKSLKWLFLDTWANCPTTLF